MPLSVGDILKGFSATKSCIEEFEGGFAEYIKVRHCIAANKGTTALYLILKAMGKLSGREEVILPAYTVPTLTLAMDKAGLKTRLCDISDESFNMDAGSLEQHITKNTLCVIPVHMFGFPCALKRIKDLCLDRNALMIEDPAQAMGAEIDGEKVGSFGDAGFFSLCKGKIISTFSGGLAVTDNDELASIIKLERDSLPASGNGLLTPAVLIAFALAMRPHVYGLFYPVISRFKSTEVHEDFSPQRYTDFQAAVGVSLLKKMDSIIDARRRMGMALYDTLKNYDWIRLPQIVSGTKPVFNHLPVVFKDVRRLERVREILWRKGIDTARMYMKPVHHIYDLGYNLSPDPFPKASYIAERLIVLPTHPYMTESDGETIINSFKEAN